MRPGWPTWPACTARRATLRGSGLSSSQWLTAGSRKNRVLPAAIPVQSPVALGLRCPGLDRRSTHLNLPSPYMSYVAYAILDLAFDLLAESQEAMFVALSETRVKLNRTYYFLEVLRLAMLSVAG